MSVFGTLFGSIFIWLFICTVTRRAFVYVCAVVRTYEGGGAQIHSFVTSIATKFGSRNNCAGNWDTNVVGCVECCFCSCSAEYRKKVMDSVKKAFVCVLIFAGWCFLEATKQAN
jgi:hypothetical protein